MDIFLRDPIEHLRTPTRSLLAFLVISHVFILPIRSEVLRTFMAELHREYITSGRREILDGKIYYDAEAKKVIVEVTSPIHQWMFLQKFETLIYYPQERKAFRMQARSDAVLPFFQLFIGCLKEDIGLGDLGYTFSRYEKKDDILISVWIPPIRFSKILGEAVLKLQANKLVEVQYKTPKGDLYSRGEFGQHVLFGGYFFPLDVSLAQLAGQQKSLERVTYSNPVFNRPLPPSIREFKIPEDVPVKNVLW